MPDQVLEDRIDDYAVNVFKSLGYSGRLPDGLVEMYQRVKKVKDRHTPGRIMIPDTYALIITLHELMEPRKPSTCRDMTEMPGLVPGARVKIRFNGEERLGTVLVICSNSEEGKVRVAVQADEKKYREILIADVLSILE